MKIMNKHTYIICIIFCLFLGLWGCVQEDFPERNGLAEGEGWLYIPFNAVDNVDVHTKATLDYSYENTIRNIYVFIFDASGNKIYGNWLTVDNLLANETAVRGSSVDSWWVNNSSTSGTPTRGGLKVKASAGGGFKVYLMTNLDADMVKASSDLIAHNISSENDLKKFKVYMNVESVNRNGQFPMTGMISNVTINVGSTTDMNNSSDKILKLKRLDAKIKFIFKKGNRADANGQKIKRFTAKQWRVINVPTTSYAIMRDTDSGEVAPGDIDYQGHAPSYFDTPWRNFEEFPSDTESGFSFYMLENRLTPKKTSFTSYNDRSRQVKDEAGQNESIIVEYVNSLGKTVEKEFRKFVNANDFSTYVLVTGRVDMDLVNDDAGQTLGADVQYLIHLGNWNLSSLETGWDTDVYSNVTNYDTERNHSYTYTVTVNSVNNIRVEVESSRDELPGDIENQPGATGEVVIAKEEIALCDAHYVSKTMTFHASNFYLVDDAGTYVSTADKLTWKVKTPFSDGSPIIEGGVDVADHLDYKWATFRLNKKDVGGSYYSAQRRKFTQRIYESKAVIQDNKEDDGTDGLRGYHNDGCMDIIALVKYIKDQTQLYVDYQNELRTNPAAVNRSDFDNGKVNGVDDPLGPKIAMTVFVNEFYYDEHPITHQTDPTLWKRFVNQHDRTMHILCDSNSSTDFESTSTGSVITIQQQAIKTIYNTELDYTVLTTAWGTESVQEYADDITHYNSATDTYSDSNLNTDQENGRANSIFEWGLAPTSKTVNNIEDIESGKHWGDFLNFEVENDSPEMKGTYKALRYVCMSRNRDNNGDGEITKDELRWYTASIRQLNGLFVGNGLLDPASRLYNRTVEEQGQGNLWKQIVISSTHNTKGNSTGGPISLWAHEGLSTSTYSEAVGWSGLTKYSIRCVRNLGMDDANAPLNEIPQNFIEHEELKDANGDTYHVFTCTHLNYAALRDYNSGELTLGDEKSPQNQLYKKFETYPRDRSIASMTGEELNTLIENNNKSSVKAGICPEGYRVPSQIELTMMNLYNADGDFNQHTRTYWSFGKKGSQKDNTKFGFSLLDNDNMTVDQNIRSTKIRCIRDIRVE